MSTVRPQRRRKQSAYRKLPPWLQWTLPFAVAIALIAALVAWVEHETNDVPSEAAVNSPSAIIQQNKQAQALMNQLQAPQLAKLKPGTPPADALKAAIATWLKGQIKTGQMNGPLTSDTCTPTAGSTATRVAMKCEMVTANVTYPFYGVVQPSIGLITYCQKVVAPVYGMPAAKLSPSCLAAA